MYSCPMPIFMDVHRDLGDVTEDDIRAAHERDLEVQDEHGVRFLTFWFNQPDGRAFCLVEAPDAESAVAFFSPLEEPLEAALLSVR